jgi:3-oxoacyl-[acyl-carrier-protein] synthase II
MANAGRECWITGVGIVSCIGEGLEAHWRAFNAPPVRPAAETFAPYIVHRIAPLELDKQIPKKEDQRQMGVWQRIGTYAAGLALDSAGAKGNPELLGRMDMIVAAAGGERDEDVDAAILSGLGKALNPGAFLNERLMSDVRPTRFLTQLSNMLAGNISIVHKVTRSSRTFMGEEGAGVDAVRVALARIEAGQSDIALVGGATNAERRDILIPHVAAGHALMAPFAPVWERAQRGGGFALGSLGAFLVLESRDHARRRGVGPFGRLSKVVSNRTERKPGATMASLAQLWKQLAPQSGVAVISGASGAEPATAEERAWLKTLAGIPVRSTGTYIGHGLEPQFIMNIALAALALRQGKLFPPADSSGMEQSMPVPPLRLVVTAVGHWRGEGMGLIEAVR